MKRTVAYIVIIGIIVSILGANFYINQWGKGDEKSSYDDYIEELNETFGDDNASMIEKINKEISNPKNSREEIGFNLLAREQYYFLNGPTEKFIEYADLTEEYLRRNNMKDELLTLYSMLSSKYTGNEKYNDAYIYIHKGEYLAKKLYEKDKSKEMLSTLIAIKYLKSVMALEVGLVESADIVFKEAEELRKECIIERIDIYTNILSYYQYKKEYERVEENALKLIDLVEKEDPEIKLYVRDYIAAKMILAENYINKGEINKSIELIEELKNDKTVLNRKISRYGLYNLYAQLYKYHGNSEEYLKYLMLAYEVIESSNSASKKVKIVVLIIEELELRGNRDELIHWYKVKDDISRISKGSEDTQYLLSQLINTDLENANYNIEILQLQKLKMIYFIIILLLLTIIVGMIIVIEKKSKKLLKENINMLERSNAIKQQYYEDIKANHENIKRIKHDIKNHIIVINKFLLQEEYEDAKKYIKNIGIEIETSSLDIVTSNKVIDAIIYNKMNICKLENIALDLDIKIPKELPLDEFDACVIYGNLLDNAIEACSKINKENANKYIKLKSIVKGDYLFINIKNSYNGSVEKNNEYFLTTKKDKSNHGIGLKNIKSCVKKYGGDMKIDYSNEEFHVSIMIGL